MTLRKHKNNRNFKITFTTRSPNRTETHLTRNGETKKMIVEGAVSPGRSIIVVGTDIPSVLRGFLFGRDASNTLTHVRLV